MNKRLFYRVGEIEAKPPQWIVKGLFEEAAISCDFGPSGGYKSFRSIDLLASVVTGKDYHGHEIRRAGPAIAIIGEGYSGFRRRTRAWEIRHGEDLCDAPLYVSARPVQFGDPASLAPVFAEIDEIAKEHGAPVLTVIDTLSRNIAGDENSSLDMPAFVDAITDYRNRYRTAVHIVHHSGHSNQERSRGHSAFRAALDWEWRFEPDGRTLRIVCTKSKDSEPPDPLQFDVHTVELDMVDEDGDMVTSAILNRVDYEPKAKPTAKSGKWKDRAYEILVGLYEEHRENIARSGRPESEAAVLATTWAHASIGAQDAGRMPKNRFYDARAALVADGRVMIDGAIAYLATDIPDSEVRSPVVQSGPLLEGDRTKPDQPGDSDRTKPDQNRTKPDQNRTKTGPEPETEELEIF